MDKSCHYTEGFADDNMATVIDDTIQGVTKKLEIDADNILAFMASNKIMAKWDGSRVCYKRIMKFVLAKQK